MASIRARGRMVSQYITGTTTTSATPTPVAADHDAYQVTALAENPTWASPGAGYNGQVLMLGMKAATTNRTVAYNAIFQNGPATMVTTAVVGVWHWQLFRYDTNVSKWVCMSSDPVGYA